ncbi:transcriptional regulator [Clostridium sporogenes]|uniref:transcriptional regulator n=1 Tax=Clostridium sporogenes TaxID=1509 RepID=UPI0013D2552E|nr:transcriptional regulator [Clostridium sporogenes]NFH48644.1 transcriptional regulator [Clostridium sporogenes]
MFYTVDQITEMLQISKSKAYKIVASLNKELKKMGYITIAGRVPKKFFEEKYYM